MLPLQNRNVFQLPLNAYRTRVVTNNSEASNAAVVADVQVNHGKSLHFAPNAALAHLKRTLEPRLTSAQRESIALLQEHEFNQAASNEEHAQIRRAKFTVV